KAGGARGRDNAARFEQSAAPSLRHGRTRKRLGPRRHPTQHPTRTSSHHAPLPRARSCHADCRFPPSDMSTLEAIFNELDLRAANATPGALATVTDLAIEIAREGREGRKIGTIFTVGAEAEVLQRSRCLILDPLAGHSPERRQIDDSDVRETVKVLAH